MRLKHDVSTLRRPVGMSTIGLSTLFALGFELVAGQASISGLDARGCQFFGFDRFLSFAQTRGAEQGETVLTSPVITARVNWTEFVASWNAVTPEGAYLRIEARPVYQDDAGTFFTLGLWSANPAHHPRQSVRDQKTEEGEVMTDVLTLRRPADRVQVRLTMGGEESQRPTLKFLGVSLADTRTSPPPLAANREAWGKLIAVPERTQMAYPNGKALCSPTSVSMILAYWSKHLARPDLEHSVPEIADAIYDSEWKGTGNWPFNTAYAGSFSGVRAYVTRLSDVSELEDWIARGIPVGLSLCYDRLRGKGPGPNGHIVVCVGFTPEGDPILNDPGTSKNVRKTFPRKNLVYAWSYSHGTVYLIYPENEAVPKDRFGHWDATGH